MFELSGTRELRSAQEAPARGGSGTKEAWGREVAVDELDELRNGYCRYKDVLPPVVRLYTKALEATIAETLSPLQKWVEKECDDCGRWYEDEDHHHSGCDSCDIPRFRQKLSELSGMK